MKRSTRSANVKKFSLENAVHLCEVVQAMEDSVTFSQEDLVVALKELVEVVVWSDRHEECVFDIFLERGIMSTFERAITNAEFPTRVKVQVFQCITILLQNLTRQSSVYVVCSNNHLNRIIALDFDDRDDELLSIYVAFLKTIAVRLNDETIQFFFERDTGAFPLFQKATKLLSDDDGIVRAAARQIVVIVAQLRDPAIVRFLDSAVGEVFSIIANSLENHLRLMSRAVVEMEWFAHIIPSRPTAPPTADDAVHYGENAGGDAVSPLLVENLPLRDADGEADFMSLGALDNHVENMVDDIYYINDLFGIPQPFFAERLEATLRDRVVRPMGMVLRQAVEELVVRFTGGGHEAQPPAANTVREHSPALLLLLFGRWMKVNSVACIHSMIAEELLGTHVGLDARGGSGSIVIATLHSPCIELYPGALLVLDAFLTSPLSKVMADAAGGATDAPVALAAVASALQATASPSSYETLPLPKAAALFANATTFREIDQRLTSHWAPQGEEQRLHVGECGHVAFPAPHELADRRGNSVLEAMQGPTEVPTSGSVAAALFVALYHQVRQKEHTRLGVFQSTIDALLRVGTGLAEPTLAHDAIVAAIGMAQLNLVNRAAQYTQYLASLYAAHGVRAACSAADLELGGDDGSDPAYSEHSVGEGISPTSIAFLMTHGEERRVADAYELLFIRLMHDYRDVVGQYGEGVPSERFLMVTALALPTLPVLDGWSDALAASLSGDVAQAPSYSHRYLALQRSTARVASLSRRAAADMGEVEYVEMAMWILLRRRLFHVFYSTDDGLVDVVKAFDAPIGAGSTLTEELARTITTVSPPFRCEVVQEVLREAALSEAPQAPVAGAAPMARGGGVMAGTPLYMVCSESALLFIRPAGATPAAGAAAPASERRTSAASSVKPGHPSQVAQAPDVMYALQTYYLTVALHPQQPFKATLAYASPLANLRITIVFRDRRSAYVAVLRAIDEAIRCRRRGASLAYLLMAQPTV